MRPGGHAQHYKQERSDPDSTCVIMHISDASRLLILTLFLFVCIGLLSLQNCYIAKNDLRYRTEASDHFCWLPKAKIRHHITSPWTHSAFAELSASAAVCPGRASDHAFREGASLFTTLRHCWLNAYLVTPQIVFSVLFATEQAVLCLVLLLIIAVQMFPFASVPIFISFFRYYIKNLPSSFWILSLPSSISAVPTNVIGTLPILSFR